jgi:hypothetical protein
MINIQPGDTVEFLENSTHYNHPTEHRFLKKGDRIVATDVDLNYVYYAIPRFSPNILYKLSKCLIRKVIPNEVEIKFR